MSLQRVRPIAVVWAMASRRHEADIQPSGRRRYERHRCVEQLTCDAATRELCARTTGSPGPGGLESTQSGTRWDGSAAARADLGPVNGDFLVRRTSGALQP